MIGLKGHTAFMYDSNYIMIFGGYSQQGVPTN
jgi:hypothetical protein